MATQDDNKGSGNDGSWFLEAVGAVSPPPTPSEAIAALELDNTLPETAAVLPSGSQAVTITSFDGSTGTSTSTFEPIGGTPSLAAHSTGEMEIPVPPAAPHEPDDTGLSPVLRTRRAFRWPAVTFGVFLVAVAALAVVWLPAALRQDAIVIKQTYADGALAVRLYLPTAQTALDAITSPDTTQDELFSAVPIISQLDSLALELQVTATAPLPRQLPLLPNEEVVALGPLQQTAQIHAAQASDVARQLGYAYVYRTTIPTLLTTGELPTTADTQTINTLSVSLASSLVADSAALSDLPITETAAGLELSARAAVERYGSWQEEYLASLSEGDEAAATLLIAELDNLRSGLMTELETTMRTFRVEIDDQIVVLAADLENFLAALTQS
ncbi:MAG: hypothetical protein BMS9Abin12_0382 [Acidimicrobiia bacterium]|nr:MAG: hypothetical protein BMS9Abin12_0382 [Acidimicrobiia bacterium]